MKKIIVITSIVTCLLIFNKPQAKQTIIPEEAIRFRIIASSNEIADQALKMDIRNELVTKVLPNLSTGQTLEEARTIVANNIFKIDEVLNQYDIDYSVNYGMNYFPDKTYKGIHYDEGKYESLVIELGEGKGDNWWCVLFPPLCLMEAKETDQDEVEYVSFVSQIINKYF